MNETAKNHVNALQRTAEEGYIMRVQLYKTISRCSLCPTIAASLWHEMPREMHARKMFEEGWRHHGLPVCPSCVEGLK